jgi:hypothetical protein
MMGDYFLMGNSVSDRTNRITLIKLVAQKLDIERGGNVGFYFMASDVVIRKEEGEYNPDKPGRGFYMGSSVVDKDNRVTIIKLVVQNLKIKERNTIEFYLHDDNVILRKASEKLEIYDHENTSEICHDIASRMYVRYIDEVTKYLIENETENLPEKKSMGIFQRVATMEDKSALSEEDMKRLSFEFEYVMNEASNSREKWKEYKMKYSDDYKEHTKRLEEIDKLIGSSKENNSKRNEPQVIIDPQKITMPKKSKIRQIFSGKR